MSEFKKKNKPKYRKKTPNIQQNHGSPARLVRLSTTKLWLPVHCPSNRQALSSSGVTWGAPAEGSGQRGAAGGALHSRWPGSLRGSHCWPRGCCPAGWPRAPGTGGSRRWTRGRSARSRRSRGCPRCWQSARCRRGWGSRAGGRGIRPGPAARGGPAGTDTPPAPACAAPATHTGLLRKAETQPASLLHCLSPVPTERLPSYSLKIINLKPCSYFSTVDEIILLDKHG